MHGDRCVRARALWCLRSGSLQDLGRAGPCQANMDWAARVKHQWSAQKLRTLSVRVASDCSGLGSPETAVRALERVGCVSSMSYEWAADWSDASQRWLEQVVGVPRHAILGDMSKRVLSGGAMLDTAINGSSFRVSHDRDVDLYVCGFPCTPFSTKGKQLGWDDANSKPFWVAAKTISTLRPKAVVLENVMGITRQGGLDKVMAVLRVIRGYVSASLVNLSNHHFGIPQHRPRVYIVMVRSDCVKSRLNEDLLGESLNGFLALLKQPSIKWPRFLERVGLPLVRGASDSSVADLQKRVKLCACGAKHACLSHPCKCRLCAGHQRKAGLACRWRALHQAHRRKPVVRAARLNMLKKWRTIRTYARALSRTCVEFKGAKIPDVGRCLAPKHVT